jgi:hypothetical protein
VLQCVTCSRLHCSRIAAVPSVCEQLGCACYWVKIRLIFRWQRIVAQSSNDLYRTTYLAICTLSC